MKIFDSFTRQVTIIFVASMVVNVGNYVFHVFMSRSLGPADYGILASLLSVFLIVSVPVGAIQTSVTKYTSHFKAQGQYEKINGLMSGLIKRLSLVGLAGFGIFTLASGSIASFLHIPSRIPILLVGTSLMLSLLLPTVLGVLQGLQKFNDLASNTILQVFSKLTLGILLVYLGLSVNGALVGYVAAPLTGFLFALVPLSFLSKQYGTANPLNFSEVYKYAFPVLITLLFFMLLTNIDVVLVKHFFTPSQAGYYSAASIVAKVIFYLPGAIGMVMFPRISELYSLSEDTTFILKKSLFYTSLICGIAIMLYFLIPSPIVLLLFGKEYLSTVPLIGLFGLSIGFFSLANVLFLYQLAVHQLKFLKVLTLMVPLELILIVLFHQNLTQVILVLLATGLFLLIVNSYYVFIAIAQRKVMKKESIA